MKTYTKTLEQALTAVAPALEALLPVDAESTSDDARFDAIVALARLGLSGAKEAIEEELQQMFASVRGEVRAFRFLNGELPTTIGLGCYEHRLWDLFVEVRARAICDSGRGVCAILLGYGFDGIPVQWTSKPTGIDCK